MIIVHDQMNRVYLAAAQLEVTRRGGSRWRMLETGGRGGAGAHRGRRTSVSGYSKNNEDWPHPGGA